MKEIPLTRGYVALVDDEDFDALSAFRWYATRNGLKGKAFYAARRAHGSGKQPVMLMHRQLLAPIAAGLYVDHINGDPLDNRRSNLRLATARQNRGNTRRTWGSLGLKGVYKHASRFKAVVAGKTVGYFKTLSEAANAYDAAAIARWGEFAATNAALGLLPSSATLTPPSVSALSTASDSAVGARP